MDRFAWLLTPSGKQIHFAFKLFMAMGLSLYVSMWLELDRPYWSALEVAVMIQPIPGMAVSRALSRALGTLIAGAVALLIIGLAYQYQPLVVVMLGAWISFCCFMASLLRSDLAYGFAIAGFIAGVIVMLAYQLPMTPFDIAVERVLECLVAALMTAAVNVLLSPPSGMRNYIAQRSRLLKDIGSEFTRLGKLPDKQAQQDNKQTLEDPHATLQNLVSQAIALENTRQFIRYESPIFANSNYLARRFDYDLLSFISALSALHIYLKDHHQYTDTSALHHLLEPARLLSQDPEDHQAIKQAFDSAYRNILAIAEHQPEKRRTLADWVAISRALGLANRGKSLMATQAMLLSERYYPSRSPLGRGRSEFSYPLAYHEATRNGIRTFFAISMAGVIWVYFHNQLPATILMIILGGLTSVFATLPVPHLVAVKVFARGLGLAIVTAFIVNFGLMPLGNSYATLMLMMGPFIFIAGMAMGSANPALSATGRICMIMFSLLTHVENNTITDFTYYAHMVMGLVGAVALLNLCFTIIFPSSPRQHLREQLTGAFNEIARGVTGRGSRERFETRMYDRLNSLALDEVEDPVRFSARQVVQATISIGLETRSLLVIRRRLSLPETLDQSVHDEVEKLRQLFAQKQRLAQIQKIVERCLGMHELAERLIVHADGLSSLAERRLAVRAAICAELVASGLGDYIDAFADAQSPLKEEAAAP